MKKPKRWNPECGESYWLFNLKGVCFCSVWGGDEIDEQRFDAGTVFRTRREAQAAARKVRKLLLGLHGGGE